MRRAKEWFLENLDSLVTPEGRLLLENEKRIVKFMLEAGLGPKRPINVCDFGKADDIVIEYVPTFEWIN